MHLKVSAMSSELGYGTVIKMRVNNFRFTHIPLETSFQAKQKLMSWLNNEY